MEKHVTGGLRTSDFGSHPLFHDVIGVIGHLLYYDEGI